MKKCPNCEQMFSDDITYCLSDGTVLQDPTQAPASFASAEMETQVFGPVPVEAVRKTDSSKWLYLIIGLMAAGLIALGTAFIYSRPGEGEKKAAANTSGNSANKDAATPSPYPAAPVVMNTGPAGKWAGELVYSYGTAYSAEMDLSDNGSGQVRGRLIWTFLRAEKRRADDKDSIEYVSGTFDKTTRALSLKGYNTDDPNDPTIVTKYDLTLGDDNNSLNGVVQGASARKAWKFNLKRASK